MGFEHDNRSNWIKKAVGAFTFAIISLMLIIFQLKMPYVDQIIILIGLIPVLTAVFQGINYMKRLDCYYIYLENEMLLIYRGIFLPNKMVDYSNIDHCVTTYVYEEQHITIRLKGNLEEVNIRADWLSAKNLNQFKEELQKRTKVEKLFRTKGTSA